MPPIPSRRGTEAHNPFPVAPADVPAAAVRAVKRTLLRSGHPGIEDPMDDDLARLIVAELVIAALHDDGTARRKSPGRRRGEPAGMTALFYSLPALPLPPSGFQGRCQQLSGLRLPGPGGLLGHVSGMIRFGGLECGLRWGFLPVGRYAVVGGAMGGWRG